MTGPWRQPIWVLPLAIAGLVGLFGWWGDGRLSQLIRAEVQSDLLTTLDANVTALEIWATNQLKLATSLAEDPKVQELAVQILEQAEPNDPLPTPSPKAEVLADYLKPRLDAIGYEIAHLVNTNLVTVANSRRGRLRLGAPVSEAHLAKFSELFALGQPVIITPFKPKSRLPRPLSERETGPGGDAASGRDGPISTLGRGRRGGRPAAPDSWRSRRGDAALMQVAAPVRDSSGVVRGALALVINPDAEFTRILSVARSGKSGETYAFDQRGLMISQSRFDYQLRKLALIENRPGASSAVTLRLADPGGDLTKGYKPDNPVPVTRPLIHFVDRALTGEPGVEVDPVRDYRGVAVVGAWRWLPQQGFGVATQLDAAEAYQPLRIMRLLFVILSLLLVLCAMGLFVFSYSNLISRRRLTAAELRLKQLGQYTLEDKIGEGGMGVVYRGRHALMRRDTAIKLLLPDRADPDSVAHFEREARLTCQLTHPNTIQVYDYGHTPDGIFYYAMEYLQGLNLHDLVNRFGSQAEARVVYILTQVCEALAEAHALGLVHHDIKPANVFLCHRGGVPDCVKVLDFGLVQEYRRGNRQNGNGSLQAAGPAHGTPLFMPPEAMRDSARSDPRSDIYSLGALGYYLLTAQYVFEADSDWMLCEKHLHEPPVPPAQRTLNPISAELEETILRCLEKEVNLRPQSVAELRALLLTSPRAADWTLDARAAWWTRYEQNGFESAKTADNDRFVPTDVTVKIDFAGRGQ